MAEKWKRLLSSWGWSIGPLSKRSWFFPGLGCLVGGITASPLPPPGCADPANVSVQLLKARLELCPGGPANASLGDALFARLDAALHFSLYFSLPRSILASAATVAVSVTQVVAEEALGATLHDLAHSLYRRGAKKEGAAAPGAADAAAAQIVVPLKERRDRMALPTAIQNALIRGTVSAIAESVLEGIGAFILPGLLPAFLGSLASVVVQI